MRALSKREKKLAVITAALVPVLAGWFLFSAWRAPLNALRTRRDNLKSEIASKELLALRSKKLQERLDEWNRRSLPSDPQIARSLYQGWLFGLAKEVGFDGTKVDVTGEGGQTAGVYRALRFTVQARATLKKLTEFLYKFESAGHLHQVRSLTLDPTAGSDKIALTFVIEALSLPGSDRQNALSEEPAERLAASDVDDYHKAITERNLFAPYKRPSGPPPTPPEPPEFDPGKYAHITAIVAGIDGQPEVWVIARTTGESFTLREGDSFDIGDLHAKVIRINERDAEIEFDGQRWLVWLGDNLREASKLPDG